VCFGLAGPAWAQGGGLGTPNQLNEDPFAGGGAPRQLTPVEQFAEKLKLDSKTQVPAVQEILSAAQREAAPIGTEIMQIRQRLLNIDLSGKPEDAKSSEDALTTASAKMAVIEAGAFAKVYALLKPNQQKDAAQAFTIMAGIFQPSAPSAGGGRGRRGGGLQ
jgi:hypothetical protein